MTERDPASPSGDGAATTAPARSTPGPAPNPNDPTRTRAPDAHVADAAPGTDGAKPGGRLPAPLQYRDPERYQIVGEHGRGGLGRVLRARDKELGRDVAVKELLERGGTSELRFFREALITARLEHPGIVPVHEAGRWPDGTPFYAMKLVQGRPLREYIDECTTIEQRLALLPHVIAVTDAIAYAHDRKIIHRDLKPANIIVGDFGETIVIDWGLAKDISLDVPDVAEDLGGSTKTAPDGLTVAGSVLGTPAYMAPEQHEGRADARSDVYAIGGILLHLLTGNVPKLDEPAGNVAEVKSVPRDLVAIIARARHSSPERRYATVAALGDDLRAYVRRAPVTARRYSLTARALLGFARHRAASIVLVTALSALSIVLLAANYRISGEREHAVTAETAAEQAQSKAQDALNALVLEHANVLLATDPSATVDALDNYHGTDAAAVRKLRAQAKGLGIATVRAQPHVGSISWMHAFPGKLVTVGVDGSVKATDTSGTIRVLATNATPDAPVAYSASSHLLAYGCNARDLCFLDLLTERSRPDVIRNVSPSTVAISPSGTHVALASDDTISVWERSYDGAAARRTTTFRIPQPEDLLFVDELHVAAANASGVQSLSAEGHLERVSASHATSWSGAARQGALAIGTDRGDIETAASSPGHKGYRDHVCDGAVTSLILFSRTAAVAYACQDGTVGTIDLSTHRPRIRARLRSTSVALSLSDDESFLVSGSNGDGVVAIDLVNETARPLVGHRTRITHVVAPSVGFENIASSEETGSIRIWEMPSRALRILPLRQNNYRDVAFLGDASSFVAASEAPSLQLSQSDGNYQQAALHDPSASSILRAIDRSRFVTFGPSGVAEVWNSAPVTLARTTKGQGPIAMAAFMPDNVTVALAGVDGRIRLWHEDGSFSEVANLQRNITGMMAVHPRGALVVATSDGGIWRLVPGGHPVLLTSVGFDFSTYDRSASTRWMAFGDVAGRVHVVDTDTWTVDDALHVESGVSDIEFSHSGDRLAIAAANGVVHIGTRSGSTWGKATWTRFSETANYVVFSPDGDYLFVACGEAGVWFLSLRSDALVSLPTTPVLLFRSRISPDGSRLLAIDRAGSLVSIDLALIRPLLGLPPVSHVDTPPKGIAQP